MELMNRRQRSAVERAIKTTAMPLLIGGATLLALDVARRLFRHAKLFCPSPEPLRSWNPEDYGIPRERTTEEWFETPDGELLYGWYARAEKPIASALFCHGNTGNLTTTADAMPHLIAAGFNILMFDYRGFGKSTGRASFSGVVSDGVTAARFHDRIRPKHLPSILYGFSLGGAVAAQIITKHPFDALMLQSTFTNVPDLTRFAYPHIPLHLVAGGVLDTLSIVRRLEVPLLVIHGGADEVCPPWMGQKIFDACPTPKRIEFIDGGLHKDLFVRDPDTIVWAVSQFLADLPKTARRASLEQQPPSGLDLLLQSFFRTVRRHLRLTVVGSRLSVGHDEPQGQPNG